MVVVQQGARCRQPGCDPSLTVRATYGPGRGRRRLVIGGGGSCLGLGKGTTKMRWHGFRLVDHDGSSDRLGDDVAGFGRDDGAAGMRMLDRVG